MDFLREVQYMSQKQIKEYIEVHWEDIPVWQLIILKYLSDVLVLPQARIDYLNRHMSHANHIREDNDIQEEEKLFTQIEVIIDEPKSIEAKTDD